MFYISITIKPIYMWLQHYKLLINWNMVIQVKGWIVLLKGEHRFIVLIWGQLTHCSLSAQYGEIYLCQHCLRYWLVAWQHQAITWTNEDSSFMKFCALHLSSQQVPRLKFYIMTLKMTATSSWGHWVDYFVTGINPIIKVLSSHMLTCSVTGGQSVILKSSWQQCPLSLQPNLSFLIRYGHSL